MENKEEEKKYAATYDGEVKENDIQQWKSRYGKVIRIDVVDGDELHVGYFHRPKLETMSAVSKIAKTDEVKSAEVMFDNCWLGGSKALREDTVLFLEVTKQLGTIFKHCMSSLKTCRGASAFGGRQQARLRKRMRPHTGELGHRPGDAVTRNGLRTMRRRCGLNNGG